MAQDGTGDFKTIREATRSNVVKPNQVIEILDAGPYVENIDVTDLPAGSGLISRAGTIVIPAVWKPIENESRKVRQFAAHVITRSPDFRLSGINCHFKRTVHGMPLQFFCFGSGVVENCTFVKSGAFYEPGDKPDQLRFFLRNIGGEEDKSASLWLRGNVSESSFRLQQQETGPVEFHVNRNLLIGSDHHARICSFDGPPGSSMARFIITENVFDCQRSGTLFRHVHEHSPFPDANAGTAILIDRNSIHTVKPDSLISV